VSPRQACEDTAAAICERYYTCFTPAELAAAHYPSTEAGCVTAIEQKEGCEAMTRDNVCTGNAEYDGAEAAKCSDQVVGLECSQIRDPFLDVKTEAPACSKVCEIN
jgi:hypothetical protein